MKSKVLFSALLGSVALASCTADEDVIQSAKQESPIKFSVTLDGADSPLTKADFTSTYALSFKKGDLMSLFHGVASSATVLETYQNAIYEGTAEEGEAFEFTTKSMVLEGQAVMVYPADTTFANTGASAPVVKINELQTAKSNTLIPYASPVLAIGAYDKDNQNGVAGYGKTYDIVLKRIGSTLELATVLKNADGVNNLVDKDAQLKVESVELNAEDGSGNGAFTTVLPLAMGDTYTDSEHEGWAKQISVDLDGATTKSKLTTKDVTNDKAVFTLLPSASDIKLAESAATNVVINTNYGKVTLKYDAEIWANKGIKTTVAAGIQAVLQGLWAEATKGTFAGENIGRHFPRTIEADMADIDMDGLHIKDEAQLLNVLKVYDVISKGKEVSFYLDGNADQEFVMSAKGLAAYEARVADADNKITFIPCTAEGEKCDVVKLEAKEETEIPAVLKFGSSVKVQLVGNWKYSAKKSVDNVSSISVVEGAKLTLSGTVEVEGTTELENNGEVAINGAVFLKVNMLNNGKIDIPGNAEFLMNNATLTNEGTIENNYSMGVQNGTNGGIVNYGTIKQMNADAYTYVSENATAGANFAVAKGETNKFGTLLLYGTGNLNTVVGDPDKKGFIKVITTAEEVGAAQIGEYANYVEITGTCKTLSGIPNNVEYIDVESSARVIWTAASVEVKGLIVPAGKSINIPRGSEVTVETAFVEGRIYAAGTFNCSGFVGYMGGKTADANNVIVSK